MAPKVGTEAIRGLAGVATGLGTNGDRFWTGPCHYGMVRGGPQTRHT